MSNKVFEKHIFLTTREVKKLFGLIEFISPERYDKYSYLLKKKEYSEEDMSELNDIIRFLESTGVDLEFLNHSQGDVDEVIKELLSDYSCSEIMEMNMFEVRDKIMDIMTDIFEIKDIRSSSNIEFAKDVLSQVKDSCLKD